MGGDSVGRVGDGGHSEEMNNGRKRKRDGGRLLEM